ncbi:MAG: amino acid racemase [Firmicutes bacterium]|nr:amino acid racemase [Bacillota bacterium]
MNKKHVLGILGGLGPMATVFFYEMLTARTSASCDQDHIDIVISSRATTPDRSAFITGKSGESPLPVMIEEAKKLAAYGADILVMPCNTAHYFYDELIKAVPVRFINIIEETVRLCKDRNIKKIGVMATEGTVCSGAYQHVCMKYGVECEIPSKINQDALMSVIFDDIKQGRSADMGKFMSAAEELERKGCGAMVLGCTELSLIKKDNLLDDRFVDSLEALADATILACGKKVNR